MTEVVPDFKYSPAKSLVWGLLAFIGICALGVLLLLPLPWKEQAIFGGALTGIGLLLNWFSRARLVTMALMAISVFSTFRYGYFRVMQTWYGVTSAGHVHQWPIPFRKPAVLGNPRSHRGRTATRERRQVR